jgi:DNA sulfur modification protein DndE
MKYKLNLSKEVEEIIKSINTNLGITPNIFCRYAVILSLKDPAELKFDFDSKGIEFQRYTLTGEFDTLFRELIKNREGRYITDDEYFGQYLKAHIERGSRLLNQEVILSGSFEKFVYEMIARGGTV